MKRFLLFAIFLFLLGLEMYSRPRVYIRNRMGGGLFGYKYVNTSIYNDGLNDIFVTNCVDGGFNRCRHQRIENVEDELDVRLSEIIFDQLDDKLIGSGITEGRMFIGDEYFVIWKVKKIEIEYMRDSFQDDVKVYTVIEAKELGLID
jgi:hypothetical protein